MKIGSITYIKSEKKYRAFCSVGGKRISKRFNTKAEATNWLALCKAEQAKGTFIMPTSMTLGEWIVEYLDTYSKPNVKPNTLENYKFRAKYLAPLANVPLQKLNSHHIQKLLNSLPTSAYKLSVFSLLASMLKKAVACRVINYNPMAGISTPKHTHKRLETFTDEELARIKKAMPQNRYGSIFLTLLATGCRLGEICALTIDNVRNGYIHIERTCLWRKKDDYNTPKSKAAIRDVSVPQSIIDLLKKEWSRQSILHGLVFANPGGGHLWQHAIYDAWKALLTKANVPYRNIHYLRHTHATNLLHQFDFVEVSKRLGHSSPSITLNVYGHVREEVQPQILQAVNDLIQ